MKLNHNTERLHAIKGFDLNLLTMFESVYIHGSITKAAGILGLTPSAVSQAIGRLRDHFSDPLFVRQEKTLPLPKRQLEYMKNSLSPMIIYCQVFRR